MSLTLTRVQYPSLPIWGSLCKSVARATVRILPPTQTGSGVGGRGAEYSFPKVCLTELNLHRSAPCGPPARSGGGSLDRLFSLHEPATTLYPPTPPAQPLVSEFACLESMMKSLLGERQQHCPHLVLLASVPPTTAWMFFPARATQR